MSIWDTIASPIISIINKVVPDKAAAAQAIATLNQLQVQGQLQDEFAQIQATTVNQSDINKVESAQPGMHFRDGAGWICVAAFGVMLLKPLIEWGAVLVGHPVQLPAIDSEVYMTMLSGLLGLGTMHTYQKVKGS